jgi:ATP-dependent helicase/nuclease subunit A
MNILTPHQNKALNYKKHISLTANAGSGKTFVLSKRYLEIAVNENLPLRNIAAITFTDKAAGELYQKIAKEIDSRIKSAEEKKLIEQLEMIRRQLVSANISTIHSFCIDILREHPVEAGIDANFTPIDEIFADELIELSVEEVIKSSLENSSDEDKLKSLIRLFSSKSILSREIASSIKHRRNLLSLAANIYNLPAEKIANHFYETFLLITEKILNDSVGDFIKAALKINSAVLNYSPRNPIAIDVKQILSNLEKKQNIENVLTLLGNLRDKMLIKSGTVAVKGYLNRENSNILRQECSFVEEFLDKLRYFEIPFNHSQIEIELANFGRIFIYFFNKTLELYSEKKKEAGYLDYEDILLFTQNILQNEDVKKSLSEKFKYIMVDEYQDTNELQYNIFLPILDHLKKGNLFVVGDEKQSIYMFRDAELEIFNKTKDEIIVSAGKESLLSLPDSFRMAPNLCLFINALFKNLFHNPNPLFNEVEHSDVVCAREDNINGNVELLLAESKEDEDEEIAEADLLTERILKLKNYDSTETKINWGDIAILCRKRKSFIELEKSFIRKNIPYAIIGGKGFYQRQSIYDIYNYFSFLLDQNDDTALVGILRSPFFSISDSEIFEISLEQKLNYWEKLKSYSSNNPTVLHIVNILQKNISLVSKVEISFLLRKIISETGYLSLLSNKINSVQELANISKLINLTINFFAEGFRTLYDYVNFIREAIEEVEDESQAVISDELNSVKIMTIHQAKGLEFPVVFLYRCGESSRKPSVKTKSVLVNKEFGLFTKVPLNENYFGEYYSAPIVQLSDYINDRKNIAEIKRLFYVGITRAENNLFLSASLKSALSAKADSFIGLLQKGLNIDFDSPQFKLNSKLKFLTKKDDNYFVNERDLEIEIPIIKKLQPIVISEKESTQPFQAKSLLTKNIHDKVFGEIISATKISVYNQCPLKYKLIYELGFSNLMVENRNWLNTKKMVDKSKQFDFNSKEELLLASSNEEELSRTDAKSAQVKGTVIHRLLSEETSEAELMGKVELYLKNMIEKEKWQSNEFADLKQDIVDDLLNYFKSENYRWIQEFTEFKNEFEVYHQHSDFYLYGIIDKLIITKDKIIIVDYKTDLIASDEIQARASQYFTQLKFYSYTTSKLFEEISHYELRIVFLKHPNEFIAMNIGLEELHKIEREIELMVKKVREGKPEKNLDHCGNCVFSIKNNCIVI